MNKKLSYNQIKSSIITKLREANKILNEESFNKLRKELILNINSNKSFIGGSSSNTIELFPEIQSKETDEYIVKSKLPKESSANTKYVSVVNKSKEDETEESESKEVETEESESKEGKTEESESNEGETEESESKEGENNKIKTVVNESHEGENKKIKTEESESNEGETVESESNDDESKEVKTVKGKTNEDETEESESNEGETVVSKSNEDENNKIKTVVNESNEGENNKIKTVLSESKEGENNKIKTVVNESNEGKTVVSKSNEGKQPNTTQPTTSSGYFSWLGFGGNNSDEDSDIEQTYMIDSDDSDEESLIDKAKLNSKKYLKSLKVKDLREIMRENKIQLSKNGLYLNKNQMISKISKKLK